VLSFGIAWIALNNGSESALGLVIRAVLKQELTLVVEGRLVIGILGHCRFERTPRIVNPILQDCESAGEQKPFREERSVLHQVAGELRCFLKSLPA
jgi:hypothetical protein